MGRLLGLVVAVAFALGASVPAIADEGWTITSFAGDIAIQGDGSFVVEERIDVDFGGLAKHGIFRYVPTRYRWDEENERVYTVTVVSVLDASGRSWPFEQSHDRANLVLKIGDPARTLSGTQTYRIRYRVQGALNAFADHDELYWNVNGTGWGVPTRSTSATVHLPGDGVQKVACYQGPYGSQESCRATNDARSASFVATRGLGSAEGLTVVVALRKGLVPEPRPVLERRPRGADEYFEATPLALGSAAFVFLGGLVVLAYAWYLHGRDHVYVKNYYLTSDPTEEVAPLFGAAAIVPEYEPPEKLRPAQVGLLLDQSADPKDVTATIVDLAARGYLTIAEVPTQGLFGHKDWKLTKAKADEAGELQDYEKTIFNALFADRGEVLVSDLAGKFSGTLLTAERELYAESVTQKWYAADPNRTRWRWAGLGCLVALAGAFAAVALGYLVGGGFVGLAVLAVGLILIPLARIMPARTAKGSELLRRVLGFRMYMLTAEQERQRFAEREGIFSAYLPYAIVFGCVALWARAFQGLGAAATATTWYTGAAPFQAMAFSNDLQSFSTTMSRTVVSTPGGSGGSGFGGGGFSGGGGGGGGGGSW